MKVSATPILDLEIDPPAGSAKFFKFPDTLIGVVIGVIISLLVVSYQHELIAVPAFNFFAFLLSMYVGIGFHELGHMVAGKAVGFSTGAVGIGGFMFAKSGDRWIF